MDEPDIYDAVDEFRKRLAGTVLVPLCSDPDASHGQTWTRRPAMNDELAAIKERRVELYGSGEHRSAQMLVDIDDLLKLIEEKDVELDDAQQYAAGCAAESESRGTDVVRLGREVVNLRAELEQLRSENEQLKGDADQTLTDFAVEANTLRAQLNTARAEIQRLTERCGELESLNIAFKAALTNQRSKVSRDRSQQMKSLLIAKAREIGEQYQSRVPTSGGAYLGQVNLDSAANEIAVALEKVELSDN